MRARPADAAAVAAALLICGPVFGPGTVIAYDMAWSPRPQWTPFVLGTGIPAPRAVPSDAAAVLLGRLLTAGAAQALILTAILVLAGAGAARLVTTVTPAVGSAGRVVAAIVAIWNPFVAERLAIGHWTVLLGYAVLPWLVRAAGSVRAGGSVSALLAWLALSALGGANALVLTAPVALVIVLWPRARRRAAGLVVLAAAGLSACWALPAIGADVTGARGGAAAFGARADTAYGLLASLLTGGGFWNAASHLAARGAGAATAGLTLLTLVALGAGLPPLARHLRPLVAAAAAGFVLVLVSGTARLAGPWDGALAAVPGGAILRDSHKLLAAWVLVLALAAGVAVDRLQRWPRLAGVRPVPAVAAALLPLALTPTLAWGLAGRLTPVHTPADLLATTRTLSQQPPGLVAVLPWNQYRRYPWNGDRISLTLAPRLTGQQVLVNDALPTHAGWIAGEDPRAAAVTADLAAGMDPVAALRRQGVRYLLVEADAAAAAAPGADDYPDTAGPGAKRPLIPASLAAQAPLAQGPNAVAYDLGPGPDDGRRPATVAGRAGWAIFVTSWAAIMLFRVLSAVARGRRSELVGVP